MSVPHSATNVVGAVVGTAGATFPLWNEVVVLATGVNQWVVAIGGLIVLVLTIRKLWMENRIAERRLREWDNPK